MSTLRKMANSGSASGSMTSYWIKFFEDSGIPSGEATNYAITFADNRITQDMLLDLNKEYLNDMGITVLGDVIAILKNSKAVHAQDAAKKRALRAETITSPATPRRSTPASRTVNHYLGSDPDAQPMNAPVKTGPKMSKELAARLGPTPEQPKKERIRLTSKPLEATAPKVRRVLPEHEGRYKIIMPQGTTERSRKALLQQNTERGDVNNSSYRIEVRSRSSAPVPRPKTKSKSSVFGRLGAETAGDGASSSVTVTGLGKLMLRNKTAASSAAAQDSSSVFARLGTTVKRAATSTSEDMDSDGEEPSSPLEYAGVFKSDAVTKAREKNLVLERKRKALLLRKKQLEAAKKKQALEQRLGPQKAEVTTTAGILSMDARQEQVNVRNRLGKTVVTAASSTTTVSSSTNNKGQGIHARLGKQLTEVSSSGSAASVKTGSGVFRRLGRPVS